MNIFDSLQLSKYGVYKVKLFVDGQWKTIIIDDYFPYTTDDMRIGATSGKQIWAALIEKALAKERGNYKGITGFQNQSAFSALTGSPVLSILTTRILKELRKHWKILMDYKYEFLKILIGVVIFQKNQYPMACETTIQRRNGILSKHVYTIMDIVERDGHKLLLLRNPSGGSVWTGNWSKEWEWWPENMKDLLEGMIRGSFWISWDDFLTMFTFIHVCRYRSNWFAYYAKVFLKYPRGYTFPVIKINVPEKCTICISAVDDWISRVKSSWITVHMDDKNYESDIKKVVACEIIDDSTGDIDLEPGSYVITVNKLNNSPIGKRDISIHSSRPISVNEGFLVTSEDGEHIKYVVDKFGQEIVKEPKDKMSIKKYTDNNSTFIAVVAWNFAYDQFLHVHLRYSITDEQLVSRSLEDNQTVDVIPPRGVQILVVIEQYAMPEIVDFPIDIDYKLSKDVDSTINGIKRGCHLPEISSSRFLEQVHREERISVADCFLDLPSNYCQN